MRRLVLAGAGHAHAQVLLAFARQRPPALEIVLVSPHPLAPYSGMVPGWLAGHYRWEECCIDFARLCELAGVALQTGCASGIDAARRELVLDTGERIGYDWLSLNIGATLAPACKDHMTVLPMRPLSALRARWDALLASVEQLPAGAAHQIVMVGGGAAGVESVLAAHARLTRLAPGVRFHFALATQDADIIPQLAPGAGRRLRRHLDGRGIDVVAGFRAERIGSAEVIGADGRSLPADTLLWATGAQAHDWPRKSGLATDERGFIRIDAAMRSLSHPAIFAAGDCARREPPLPKAGVYAVRMAPVLAHNLQAAIGGRPLRHYRPQRRHLVLIGTGDAHAVAAWGPFAWQGAWVWQWKQRIDRRFVARYNTASTQALFRLS